MNLVVIFIYLGALLLVGAYFSKRITSGKSFMVADRSLPWYVNTGTIAATYLGAGSLIGGAALAYERGLAAAWFDIGGIIALVALAFMAKRIRRFDGLTTPEILGARFNPATRSIAALVVLLAETAIVGYQIRAGAYVLNVVTGMDSGIGMIVTALFIIAYTVSAGLVSVAYTDFIQGITIVVALVLGLPFLLGDAGGFANAMQSVGPIKSNLFSMSVREMLSTGLPTFCLVFVMQPIWQRIFASKNNSECQKAVVLSVPFVTLIVFVLVLFATVGSYLYTTINPDIVILHIAVEGLPTFLTYLVLCAGVAIIVSTGDSMLLSGASNIVNDFYLQFVNPKASDKHVVFVSRAVVVVLGIIAYIEIKFFPSVLDMVFYAYTMEGGLAPALFAAFYWKRASALGGLASVLSAGVVTVLWEALGHPMGIDTIFVTLAVSTLALIVVSLATPPPSQAVIDRFFTDKKEA